MWLKEEAPSEIFQVLEENLKFLEVRATFGFDLFTSESRPGKQRKTN
jgi:hypothetical protein